MITLLILPFVGTVLKLFTSTPVNQIARIFIQYKVQSNPTGKPFKYIITKGLLVSSFTKKNCTYKEKLHLNFCF